MLYATDRVRIIRGHMSEQVGMTGTITRRHTCTPPEVQRYTVELDNGTRNYMWEYMLEKIDRLP